MKIVFFILSLVLLFPFSIKAQDKEFVVLLLAGHTTIKGNRGAPTHSGKWENEFNDGIVNLFSDKKNQLADIEYILAPSTQNLTLQQKVELANIVKPDLYIEIHHDSGLQEDIDKAKKEGDDSPHWEGMSGFCLLYYDDGAGKESRFPKESLKLDGNILKLR